MKDIFTTLNKIVELTTLGDLQEIITSIVSGTTDVMGCDIVTLYTYDEERDTFDFPPAIKGKIKDSKAFGQLNQTEKNSVVHKIISTDTIYVSEDTSKDSFAKNQFVQRESIKSLVGVPLIANQQKVGVMVIGYRENHHFTKDELSTIHLFSSQAAIAIYNAKLLGQLRTRANTLGAVYKASNAITSSLEIENILSSITEQAYILTSKDRDKPSSSYLALVEGSNLTFVASYPTKHLQKLQNLNLDLNQKDNRHIGISGRTIKTGKTNLVSDVTKDSDYIQYEPAIRSELAVPMIIGGRVIGIISVEHSKVNAFVEEDIDTVELLAAQAAVAIENARLFNAAEQRAENLSAILRFSQTSISSLDLEHILTASCQAVVHLLKVDHSGLVLFDEDLTTGRIFAEYPKIGTIGATFSLRGVPIEEHLITSKIPINVVDVVNESGFDPIRDVLTNLDTRSILIVPIISKGRIFGSFSLDVMKRQRIFTSEEIDLCQVFAAQVAVAIENARQYEELKQVKGLVGSRTALAWMGMASSTWRHSIEGKAVNIMNIAALMKKYLKTEVNLEDINSKLEMIERLARNILERPITPPLASEEGLETFNINQLLETRTQQLREDISKSDIIIDLKLKTNEPMLVFASPEWIRRGIDLLIENSIRAMVSSSTKQLTISSSVVGNQIKILIRDTGKGISSDLMPKLFIEPITKRKDEKGLGMGLLIAQTIFQTYGGNIYLLETSPSGTTFSINLPKYISTP